MNRRTVITGSIGALTLVAGCLSSESGGGTNSNGSESAIRLRYGYYPDNDRLWVHHNGGPWLYADRGDRLRAVGEGGPWTVFDPDGSLQLFAIAATQRVSGVPPGTELDLVYVPGGDGSKQVLDTFTTPTETQPVPSAPEDAPTNAVTFAYSVNADRTELTVTHDGGPDVQADRLAIHIEGRKTPWKASDGTVSEGDAQTAPLESGDRYVKVSWRPESGWVRLAGNHILES